MSTGDDRDELNRLTAELHGDEPADEAGHFVECPICGQAVDQRRLGDVIYHLAEGHSPLPIDS